MIDAPEAELHCRACGRSVPVGVAPGRVLGTITPSVDDLRAAVAGCLDGH